MGGLQMLQNPSDDASKVGEAMPPTAVFLHLLNQLNQQWARTVTPPNAVALPPVTAVVPPAHPTSLPAVPAAVADPIHQAASLGLHPALHHLRALQGVVSLGARPPTLPVAAPTPPQMPSAVTAAYRAAVPQAPTRPSPVPPTAVSPAPAPPAPAHPAPVPHAPGPAIPGLTASAAADPSTAALLMAVQQAALMQHPRPPHVLPHPHPHAHTPPVPAAAAAAPSETVESVLLQVLKQALHRSQPPAAAPQLAVTQGLCPPPSLPKPLAHLPGVSQAAPVEQPAWPAMAQLPMDAVSAQTLAMLQCRPAHTRPNGPR